MELAPTVYVVNQDPIANSLTKQLLKSINVFCLPFKSPAELFDNNKFSTPACFLLSFLLPEMSGMEVMLKLRRKKVIHPCIFTSTQIDPELIIKAMHAGSFGFIKKPFQTMEFIELIQKALEYDGKTNRYAQIGIEYEKNINKLSAREKAVLALILYDLSAMKIGERLGISHRTVENHRNKIFIKFGISKTSELIRLSTIYETVSHTGLIDALGGNYILE